jgi:hypothetical protein
MPGAAVRDPDAELQTLDTAAGCYKVGEHQYAAAIAKAIGALLKQVLTQPFLKALPGNASSVGLRDL